jgi:uncharacterized membrane protein YdjX (TVP38/TMEM64 family)
LTAATAPARYRRLLRPAIGTVVIAVAFLGAQRLRADLGMEWSSESIRATVDELGVLAPLGFLVLVMLRQFMALPSVLVLTSAGLLFGAVLGTVLGGLGITLNALVLFGAARFMGRDFMLPRLEARYPGFEERARTTGPLLIAVMTGHPMGVLTPFHFAAGVTRMSFLVFVVAVLPAALFRAACYAFLGAHLLDPGSPRFWVATLVLVLAALLPLAHPGLRARLLRRG